MPEHVYMIERVHHYCGWNGREVNEEVDVEYGWFPSAETAQAKVDELNEPERERVKKFNAKQDRQLAQQQARQAAAKAQNEVLERVGLPLVSVPRVDRSYAYHHVFGGDHDESYYYRVAEIEQGE